MDVQTDNQIHSKPKCEMKECTNDALCLVYDKMICGKCVIKLQEKQKAMVFG